MNIEETTASEAPRDWNRGPTHHSLGLCPCDLIKIREVTGARGLAMIYFRAVAQLGRAPGSGQAPNEYAHLLPRVLICFFIGKRINWASS